MYDNLVNIQYFGWLNFFMVTVYLYVRTVCASEELENGRGNVLRPKTDE